MKIQYSSDLHLELYDNSYFLSNNPFEAVGDVLILAGDTFPLRELKDYRRNLFFDWCSYNFPQTLIIPGNHEYYYEKIDKYPEAWEMEIRPNVKMHENRSVVIDNVEFILSTMWTKIPDRDWLKLKRGMSDFRCIRTTAGPFNIFDYNTLHERDLAFIQDAVANSCAEHKVVVTHHVPSSLCVAQEFVGSNIEKGFTVDLTKYIKKSKVDAWIYGHSHRNIDTIIGKTRLVSNQLGYVVYREHKGSFSGEKYIEV